MANIANNSSILALKQETTEGTPVSPTAATDYTTLQEGFSLTPAFNTLENAELSGSKGPAKAILGTENPSISMAHYIRASGAEADAPDYSLLLKSALGQESVAAAEYNTIAASTTTVVKVDAGEGASYERGECLLVKNSVGGATYEMRNILSVSTDDLNLAFRLATAPGVGINLGKAVLYKPATSNEPTFATWLYRGNGGAVEMVSGCRVTEMSISAEAGNYVNGSFTIGGVAYYFNPIEIAAGATDIDFTDDVGDVTASLTAGTFYKDPHEAAAALGAAMTAASVGSGNDTITVTYSDSTGKFTVASNGTTFAPDWATTVNTLGATFGFTADDAGSTSYVSDSALDLSSPQSPTYDSNTNPVVAKNNQVLIGDQSDYACFAASSITITYSNEKADIMSVCEESGKAGSIIAGRSSSINIKALLSQYDVDKFRRFREGDVTQFAYNFGEKSGGNWVAGKCCNVFCPTCTINEFTIEDQDGLAVLNITLSPYVSDGLDEFYINFV